MTHEHELRGGVRMLVGEGLQVEGNKWEKKWDNCNSIIKYLKLKGQFLSHTSTFQVINNRMWLVATVLDSVNTGHFHHCKKFSWTALLWSKGTFLMSLLWMVIPT